MDIEEAEEEEVRIGIEEEIISRTRREVKEEIIEGIGEEDTITKMKEKIELIEINKEVTKKTDNPNSRSLFPRKRNVQNFLIRRKR